MFASAGESMPVVRDVLLRDGSTLRLQAPTPADFDDVTGFFDGLSAQSRFMRFHGYARSDVAARAVVEAGGPDRCSLVARHDGRVVAVAGFDGLREMGAAEVAFAVADDFQRRGAATRMLEQLAEIATERGITRFYAEVLFANRAMLGVFEGAGFEVRRELSFGEHHQGRLSGAGDAGTSRRWNSGLAGGCSHSRRVRRGSRPGDHCRGGRGGGGVRVRGSSERRESAACFARRS
jgi:RimJ/RimL family protein N-acetyltransferase